MTIDTEDVLPFIKAARQALGRAESNSMSDAVLREILSEANRIINEAEAILRLGTQLE